MLVSCEKCRKKRTDNEIAVVCLIRILLVAVDGEIPVVVLMAGAISQSVPSLLRF